MAHWTMVPIVHTLSTRHTVIITHTYNLRYNNSDKDGDLISSDTQAHTTDPFNFKQALLRNFAGVLTVQENLDLYDS